MYPCSGEDSRLTGSITAHVTPRYGQAHMHYAASEGYATAASEGYATAASEGYATATSEGYATVASEVICHCSILWPRHQHWLVDHHTL